MLVFSFAKLSCKTKLFCEDFCNGQSQYRNADRLRPSVNAGSEAGSADAGSEKAGCKRIFREKVSGASRDRPDLKRMLDQIREGDIIVVWKLDRLARSTRDLLETMETIRESGGQFQLISEPWADSTSYAGKMIMTVFAGIAEFERDLIRERTAAGRMAAKSKGVRFGRPRKLNPQQAKLAKRLLDEGKLVSEIAETFGVHVATIYRLGADQ